MANQRLEAKKDEIVQREQRRQTNAQGWALIGGIIGAATGVNLPINPAGVSNPDKIKQELQEANESEQQTLALSGRQHEFEADREGYVYVSRAGFDPRGCLRVMDVLGRTPGAEFDSSHPAIPRRIEKLNALSLRVNSRFGSAKGGFTMSDL